MKKRGFFFVTGIITAAVVGGVAIAAVVIWLRIEALKARLVENIGSALGAKVEVSSLDLDLGQGEVRASGITLVNTRPDAPWDRGEIAQATVRFHWADFFAPVQPLDVEVDSWRLVLRPSAARGDESGNGGASSSAETEPPPRLTRHGIDVTRLKAHEGEVDVMLAGGRQATVHGVEFAAEKNDAGTWSTQARMTALEAGSLTTQAGAVEIRADAGQIVFSNLRVACDPGAVTGEGEIATGAGHEARASLQAVDLPVSMLVAAPWQMKLSGLASGNLDYHADERTALAQGQIALKQGRFNVLPFLGKLTAMVGLPDITDMEVDQATAAYAWQDGALKLTQIDIRKNDVLRVAGEVDLDATGQVDGRLKLGLPVAVASKWPQLQTAVFSTPEDDCDWADVHVTGTPDHLQEDLTPRLLATGLQSGGTLLNQGAQKAADWLKSFMGP